MTEKRNLRVFCPTHEAAFDVVESPKIICEITEHALSVGFPDAEFWEFCCNCETFTPSLLDKGEKARTACFGCGNEISKIFVCNSCKIVGFESAAQTKGKNYSITAKGIEPACPGCQNSLQNVDPVLHRCKEIGAGIFTSRKECPFCLEKIAGTDEPIASQTVAGQCPQCQAFNPPTASFCGKCKYRLRMDVAVANPGNDVNKTQLLGSLCPNCGTPIPPGSDFCGECGQAVKKSFAPPPPPPPKKLGAEPQTVDIPAFPSSTSSTSAFPGEISNNVMRNLLIGIGGAVLLLVIIAIASNASKSSSETNANYSKTDSYSNNYNTRQGNSSSTRGNVNMSPAEENNFSVVGKYGYITINANLRNGPDRHYDDIGTLFQNTRVKILQVAQREDSSDWWEVEVENPSDYGCSSVNPSICGKDDPSDATQGWVNSKFVNLR